MAELLARGITRAVSAFTAVTTGLSRSRCTDRAKSKRNRGGCAVAICTDMPTRQSYLTFVALFAAAVASVATSAPSWTAGDEETGDVTVGEGSTAIAVHVRSSRVAAITVVAEADVAAGRALAPPVRLRITPHDAYKQYDAGAPTADAAATASGKDDALTATLVDGSAVAVAIPGPPVWGPSVCGPSCEEYVTVTFERAAGGAPVHVHWTVKAGISGDDASDPPDGEQVDVSAQ